MTPAQRRFVGWLPATAWLTMIFVLSSQPALPSPPAVNDKQAHAFTFGVLAVLLLMGLAGWRWASVTRSALLTAFLLAAAYGVTDELHQRFVPGRTPDVADVAADAAGAALAMVAAGAWAILLHRRRSAARP
ncbi:VanZ family protein [Luteitalea sp.]|uniref:VanZ family protein n=1 Tax=Luteitalea sp. TaxID=2004800 RepID=UPI0037C66C1A